MSKQAPLTDSNCIEWAEKQEWSLTQALFLIRGEVPPKSELGEEILRIEFSKSEKLLRCHKENHLRKPEEWIGNASLGGMGITDSWKAIFPKSIMYDLGFLLDGEPDYRHFIEVFTRDKDTTLIEMARYVLNTNEPEKLNPQDDFNYFLRDMNSALKLGKTKRKKLLNHYVSPRSCIKNCTVDYYLRGRKCFMWLDWLNDHPELADWLKNSDESPIQTITKTTEKTATPHLHPGGDPLAREIKKFVHQKGMDHLNPDSFLLFIQDNPSFDTSHGEITFKGFGGSYISVKMTALRARFRRLCEKHIDQ